ncbi:MAG: hypothetical protein ABIL44_05750 [candidate division WOR-3 bacterium]
MEKNGEKKAFNNNIIIIGIIIFICTWLIVIIIPELSLPPEITMVFENRVCKLLLAMLLAVACNVVALFAFFKWIDERRKVVEKLKITTVISEPMRYIIRNKNFLFALFLLLFGIYCLLLFFFFAK